MIDLKILAQEFSAALSKCGPSEVTHATSLFTGQKSTVPGIRGAIDGRKYKVIMFEGDAEASLPSASVHMTCSFADEGFTSGHLQYWNSDRRFSKMYRQDDDTFLTMDAFLSNEDGGELLLSVAKIWETAIRQASKLNLSYERAQLFD